MLRLLLLGCLLVGLAAGLSNGWIELHLSRFLEDVGLSLPEEGEGFDFNRWLIEGRTQVRRIEFVLVQAILQPNAVVRMQQRNRARGRACGC